MNAVLDWWAGWCPASAAWRRVRGSGGGRGTALCAVAGVGVYAGAAAVLCAALVMTVWHGLAQPWVAGAFAGFVALGSLARTPLPGDREQAPLGAAGALAYALLGSDHGVRTTHGVLQVAAVTAVGGMIGLVPHLVRGRPLAPDLVARRVLSVAFAATLFQPLYDSGTLDRIGLRGPLYGLFLAGCAGLAALCDVLLATLLRYCRTGAQESGGQDGPDEREEPVWHRASFGRTLHDELAALLGIGSAIVATGMVMAVAVGEVGLWALPLFSVPLLFTQVSFRRYAAVRATQRQTVASLARATEVAGYTLPGHAHRVASLARRTGRELGMGERELRILEHAALMHDIGQLSLVDPVPGGATVVLPAEEQQRIAKLGSEVIRQTGVPREVAEVVARQAEPYRGYGLPGSGPPPLAARIIRVVNAYADLLAEGSVEPAGAGLGLDLAARLEVLERLRLDSAREFEPRVVEALVRVCTRS